MHSSALGTMVRIVLRSLSSAARCSPFTVARYSSIVVGFLMARRLAREEGLFAGTSSGANVIASIEVANRLGPGAKVVTQRLAALSHFGPRDALLHFEPPCLARLSSRLRS